MFGFVLVVVELLDQVADDIRGEVTPHWLLFEIPEHVQFTNAAQSCASQ